MSWTTIGDNSKFRNGNFPRQNYVNVVGTFFLVPTDLWYSRSRLLCLLFCTWQKFNKIKKQGKWSGWSPVSSAILQPYQQTEYLTSGPRFITVDAIGNVFLQCYWMLTDSSSSVFCVKVVIPSFQWFVEHVVVSSCVVTSNGTSVPWPVGTVFQFPSSSTVNLFHDFANILNSSSISTTVCYTNQ